MKKLKRIHNNTDLTTKTGVFILATIILPLLVALISEVIMRQNIVF
jgi:hypothetical protein